MNAPSPDIYEFDEFRIDTVKRLLTLRGGEVVPLAPKAFETLLYLVRHPAKLLEKEELMQAVWVDTIVEENNLNQSIAAIRRVLGERHDEHRFIVTVPGRGYRFVAEVLPRASDETSQTRSHHEQGHPRFETNRTPNRNWIIGLIIFIALGLGPLGFYLWRENATSMPGDAQIQTVAVLPFRPLVTENRNEALELGVADALISKLSDGEGVIVRPLDSVRRSVLSERDSLTVGRELGVEAVLDGSIQASGERIRISARLLRTSDGKQLWATSLTKNLPIFSPCRIQSRNELRRLCKPDSEAKRKNIRRITSRRISFI